MGTSRMIAAPGRQFLVASLATLAVVAGLSREYLFAADPPGARPRAHEADRHAKAALDDARARGDATALCAVARRWPKSTWADDALFAAAELCYRRAHTDTGEAADKLLLKAVRCLSAVAGMADSPLRVSATVGLAIIYARGGLKVFVGQTLNDVRDLPDHTPVAFADVRSRLGSLIREIDGGKLPTCVRAPLISGVIQPPLRRIFSVAGADVFIARDHGYRPVRFGGHIAMIQGPRVLLVDTAASEYRMNWAGLTARRRPMRWTPMPAWECRGVAALSRDGRVLAVAHGQSAGAVSVETGKGLWAHTMSDFGLLDPRSFSVGQDVAVVADQGNRVACVAMDTGKLKWTRDLKPCRQTCLDGVQITAGHVLVRHDDWRNLTCMRIATGEVLWQLRGGYLEAHAATDGLVVLMADGELFVSDITDPGKRLWSRKYGKDSDAVILGLSANKIAVLPRESSNQIQVLSLMGGRGIGTFTAADFGGNRASPVEVRFGDRGLVVVCSSGPTGWRRGVYGLPAEISGLNVQRFDLKTKRACWSRDVQSPSRTTLYSLPMVMGRKHVVVRAQTTGESGPAFVAILDRATGKVVQKIDLGPPPPGAAKERPHITGQPVMMGGRLCVEDSRGVTIYGSK